MGDKVTSIVGSIIVLATLTTLVLPGRQTGTVIKDSGSALSGAIRAAMGR